jgi:hypothetical protein
MNLNSILKRSWHMLWNYRSLWLLGIFLPAVSSSLYIPFSWLDHEDNQQWTQVKINDNFIIQIPGGDATIDLTRPEDIRIVMQNGPSWDEFRSLVDEVERDSSIRLWPILIEFFVILIIIFLLRLFFRYITESAVIHMVAEFDKNGKRVSVREGLRRGWSNGAGRLFLLDLVFSLIASIIFVFLFGMAATPLIMVAGSHETTMITVGLETIGLLLLAGFVWFAVILLISLILQPIRRSVVLEKQKLFASIRQGSSMTRQHLKDVSLVWLVWMGIRVIWIPLSGLLLFLLAPLLLLTFPVGIVLGGIITALVAGVTSLFTGGINAWIMGALAGLPIFILVIGSPIIFLAGLVKVYLSSMWTLAYRMLMVVKNPI